MAAEWWTWGALLAGGSAAIVANLCFGREAVLARKIIFQFILVIALPLAVILSLPLAVLESQVPDLDPRIIQALIAAVVIATGWMTGAIFSEVERARAKAEKLRDYHKAIYAEIGYTLEVLWDGGNAEENSNKLVDKMRDDPNFIPLIPREQHDVVYDALVDEIEVLPRVTIDAIVAYYSLLKSHAAQVEDMRGELFRGDHFSQDRRIQMYLDYFETRKTAFAVGQTALMLIREYAEKGSDAAAELAKDLSNRGAAQHGHQRGSEKA